jgi:hypothetical protein
LIGTQFSVIPNPLQAVPLATTEKTASRRAADISKVSGMARKSPQILEQGAFS